jgi:hypothetical protein
VLVVGLLVVLFVLRSRIETLREEQGWFEPDYCHENAIEKYVPICKTIRAREWLTWYALLPADGILVSLGLWESFSRRRWLALLPLAFGLIVGLFLLGAASGIGGAMIG